MNDTYDPSSPSGMYIPERPAGHPSKRGRPKGSVNTKPIVARIAFEKHKVKEKGKVVKRSTLDLLIILLQQEAMAGNHRAAAIRDRYFGGFIEPDVRGSSDGGVMLAPAEISAEEWMEKMKLQNAKVDELMREIQEEEAGKP